jgi:hypothetical protein
MDYALPRAEDAPSFTFETRNVRCATNPLGVKGAGEAGAIGEGSTISSCKRIARPGRAASEDRPGVLPSGPRHAPGQTTDAVGNPGGFYSTSRLFRNASALALIGVRRK